MIGALILRLFTGEAAIYLARLRKVALVYALMGVFALAALLYLVGAVHAWFALRYGPVATSIGFALVCLAIVAVLYAVLTVVRRPPPVRAQDRMQRDIASIAGVAAMSNLPSILRGVRRRKSLVLVPVALAGAFGVWRALRGRRYDD